MKWHKGFSLIELLVVVLVIGLMVSVASLSVSRSTGLELRDQAASFANTASLIVEESILNGTQWGVIFDREEGDNSTSYRWLILAEGRWEESVGENFVGGRFADGVSVELELEGLAFFGLEEDSSDEIAKLIDAQLLAQITEQRLLTQRQDEELLEEQPSDREDASEDDRVREIPQIFFLPNGEITPFKLTLFAGDELDEDYQEVIIEGDLLGRISFNDGRDDVEG